MSSVTLRQASTAGRIRYVDLGHGTWAPEADEAVYSNYIELERRVVTMPSVVGTSFGTVAAVRQPPAPPAPQWGGSAHASASITMAEVSDDGWLSCSAVTPAEAPPVVGHLQREVEFLCSHLEPDELPPSAPAIRAAERHLRQVASAWGDSPQLPLPQIETSGSGDVLFDWNKGSRNVALSISSRGQAHETRARINGLAIEESRDADPATPDHTAEDLKWMLMA